MSTTLAHGEPYPPLCVSYIYSTPITGGTTFNNCAKCGYPVADGGASHVCPVVVVASTASTGNIPHKCPCCDGWGERNTVRPLDCVSERMETCRACNGSGIIWGQ